MISNKFISKFLSNLLLYHFNSVLINIIKFFTHYFILVIRTNLDLITNELILLNYVFFNLHFILFHIINSIKYSTFIRVNFHNYADYLILVKCF